MRLKNQALQQPANEVQIGVQIGVQVGVKNVCN